MNRTIIFLMLIAPVLLSGKPIHKQKGYSRSVKALIERKQYDSAIVEVQTKQRAKPNRDFSMLIGMIYREAQNFDSALVWFNRAAEKSNATEPLRQRGVLLATLGDTTKAYEDISRVLAIEPRDWELRTIRAQLAMSRGDAKLAVQDFELVLKKVSKTAALYEQTAKAWYACNALDSALIRCNQAIAIDPENLNYAILQGALYFAKGDYARALTAYETVLARDSLAVSALVGTANTLVQMKRTPEAILFYSKAIAATRGVDDSYLLRGEAYAILEQHDSALADFNTFIAENPSVPDGLIARAYNYLSQKWYDLAAADFTAALMIEPANTTILWALSWTHLLRRDFGSAQGIADEALTIDEKLWGVYGNKGHARLLLNDFESAKKLYTVWLANDPDVLSGKAKPADLLSRDFQELQKAGIHSPHYRKMVTEFLSPILSQTK